MSPAHGGMRKPKTYRQGTFSSTGSRRVHWGGDKVAEVEKNITSNSTRVGRCKLKDHVCKHLIRASLQDLTCVEAEGWVRVEHHWWGTFKSRLQASL